MFSHVGYYYYPKKDNCQDILSERGYPILLQWPMKYADRIKLIMKNRDINQDKMAEYSGVAQSTINRVLNGASIPNHKTLTRIAKGLSVPVEALTHPNDATAEIIFELSRMDQEHIVKTLEYVKAMRVYKSQPSPNTK